MKKTVIILIIVLAVLGAGIYLFLEDSKYNTSNSDEKLDAIGQEFAIVGRDHIKVGASHGPYNSNPPTSGPHYEVPAAWGIYPDALADEQLIHNLEHGGIWISYKDIDADTKAKLETIARNNPGSVIMTPRMMNEQKIVLASWGRLETFDGFDEGKILEFIRHNKNKSPEPLAR